MQNFMKKVLLSSIFSASFMLTGVNATDLDARSCDHHNNCHDHHSHHSHHSHHDHRIHPVYASFRNDTDQLLLQGNAVTFNETDINVGGGISLESASGHFFISSTGNYVINYGINNLEDAIFLLAPTLPAVNFVLVRGNSTVIKDQIGNVSGSTSSSIILSLQAGDIVWIQAQGDFFLQHTNNEGASTNTSYITFTKLPPPDA